QEGKGSADLIGCGTLRPSMIARIKWAAVLGSTFHEIPHHENAGPAGRRFFVGIHKRVFACARPLPTLFLAPQNRAIHGPSPRPQAGEGANGPSGFAIVPAFAAGRWPVSIGFCFIKIFGVTPAVRRTAGRPPAIPAG